MSPSKRARCGLASPALPREDIQTLQRAAFIMQEHNPEKLRHSLDLFSRTTSPQFTSATPNPSHLDLLQRQSSSGSTNFPDQIAYHDANHQDGQYAGRFGPDSSIESSSFFGESPLDTSPFEAEQISGAFSTPSGYSDTLLYGLNWPTAFPASHAISGIPSDSQDHVMAQDTAFGFNILAGVSEHFGPVSSSNTVSWGHNSPLRNAIADDSSSDKFLGSSSESATDASGNELNFEGDVWQSNIQASNISSSLRSSGSSSSWSLLDELKDSGRQSDINGVPSGSGLGFTWIRDDPNSRTASNNRQRRRAFTDERLRQETSNTRKMKACVRCRMQKVRCVIDDDDPTGVCKTCQTVSVPKVYTLPCVRFKITECTLYRTGKAPGLEFTFRWPTMKLRDINDWANNQTRHIMVKSDVCPVSLELTVRKFVPHAKDSLKKGWMDGKIKKFKETTPFAIVNMKNAVKDLKDYIELNVVDCMKYLVFDADTTDPLVRETYNFAVQHQKCHQNDEEGTLLSNLFRLWFAIRRTATTEHITGNDTLDMMPETVDRSYPLFGKVPMPPVMIQQLDMILTLGLLQPLRKRVLEDFQRIVMSNRPKTWLTVYLTSFIFLHSCATLSAENYRNARKHGLRRRYSMPTFISELHHGANTFLAHYHYRTQPCDPFKLDWRRRQATPFAEMTTGDIHFLRRTSELVKQRENAFRFNMDEELYEDDLYFIGQMFETNWNPRDTKIDFDDGTIGDVPLRQVYQPTS